MKIADSHSVSASAPSPAPSRPSAPLALEYRTDVSSESSRRLSQRRVALACFAGGAMIGAMSVALIDFALDWPSLTGPSRNYAPYFWPSQLIESAMIAGLLIGVHYLGLQAMRHVRRRALRDGFGMLAAMYGLGCGVLVWTGLSVGYFISWAFVIVGPVLSAMLLSAPKSHDPT